MEYDREKAVEVVKNGPYNLQKDPNSNPEMKVKSQAFYDENGFYYEETWDLDRSFICWIVPRLAYLRDNHTGVPQIICAECNDDIGAADKKWTSILSQMVEGFLYYVGKGVDRDEAEEQVTKALELFKAYFTFLWD